MVKDYRKRFTKEYLLAVSQGLVDGAFLVRKFGANKTVGTSLEPIATGGVYQTPQTLQSLEFVSDDPNDTAAGTGARVITYEGLGAGGVFQTEDINTNGTTAVPLANQYLRLYRKYVKESGTYASFTTPSHSGNLTTQVAGGGSVWAQISNSPTGLGQSQIACYTVPEGYTAYMIETFISVDSNKSASVYFFKRENILQTSAPYSAFRVQSLYEGVNGAFELVNSKNDVYPELTDIGFMGIVNSGTCSVSAEFVLLLEKN